MAVKRGSETFSGFNKPKRTPNHPTKSHAVLAKQGDKVKVSLRFRGREMRHTELGEKLLNRVCADIENVGSIEQEAEFEGRQLIMVLAPKHN